MRIFPWFFILVLLCSCREEEAPQPEVVRGLKAHVVAPGASTTLRRFPAVLEPSELSVLSFEIGGALGAIDLDVGQRVAAGETVARLDTTSLVLQVENAEAAAAQAGAAARNAADTLARQQALLDRGATTRVAVDDARAQADQAAATLTQAQKSLETAQENLAKAELRAPMGGIVNSVEVSSYATVAAGTPIVSIYPADAFEVAFAVNFDTVSQLVVGKPATIRLADRPDVVLDAVVSEIGARADAVSSFPIVLELRQGDPLLKAGMAVEAAIEFPLPAEQGYAIPLSALIKDGRSGGQDGGPTGMRMGVYVFDPGSETVMRREVTVGGIRQNAILVTEGLQPGDLVASAGVSFLDEGQKVRLLTPQD